MNYFQSIAKAICRPVIRHPVLFTAVAVIGYSYWVYVKPWIDMVDHAQTVVTDTINGAEQKVRETGVKAAGEITTVAGKAGETIKAGQQKSQEALSVFCKNHAAPMRPAPSLEAAQSYAGKVTSVLSGFTRYSCEKFGLK